VRWFKCLEVQATQVRFLFYANWVPISSELGVTLLLLGGSEFYFYSAPRD
jgi:hypothetical protein